MMLSIVDEIAMKHCNAPSNLSVEDVNVLLKAISDAEVESDNQYRIIRKYREALEAIYVVENLDDIEAIVNEALNND